MLKYLKILNKFYIVFILVSNLNALSLEEMLQQDTIKPSFDCDLPKLSESEMDICGGVGMIPASYFAIIDNFYSSYYKAVIKHIDLKDKTIIKDISLTMLKERGKVCPNTKFDDNVSSGLNSALAAQCYDSFDFRDQDHIFNDDGSIKELGQPVGAWDYNEMKFDVAVSLSQMSKYTERDDISTLAAVGATMAAWSKLESAISIKKYENYKKQNIYPIYNHDYQQTQKNFNLGCDFLVTSPTFKNIKIPKDLKFKNLFRIIVSLQENK